MDEATHWVNFEGVTSYQCRDCGESWTESLAYSAGKAEGHNFGAGGQVCALCGYETSCAHPHLTTQEVKKNYAYSDVDDDSHLGSWAVFVRYRCPDCGASWDGSDGREGSERSAHSYTGGVCDDCDHACAHSKVRESARYEEKEAYAPTSANMHSSLGYAVPVYICRSCGESWSGERPAEKTQTTERHDFNGDGLCELCGYQCRTAARTPGTPKGRRGSTS